MRSSDPETAQGSGGAGEQAVGGGLVEVSGGCTRAPGEAWRTAKRDISLLCRVVLTFDVGLRWRTRPARAHPGRLGLSVVPAPVMPEARL